MGSSVRSIIFTGFGFSLLAAALTFSITVYQMFQIFISPSSLQNSVFNHPSVSTGLLRVSPLESTFSGTEVLHALDDLLKQGITLNIDNIVLSMESDVEKQDVSFIKPQQTYQILITRDDGGDLIKVTFLETKRGMQ